jgi:hypothetical protein
MERFKPDLRQRSCVLQGVIARRPLGEVVVRTSAGTRVLHSREIQRSRFQRWNLHIADGRNCLLLVARGLRILQAFTGFCRAKPLIFICLQQAV